MVIKISHREVLNNLIRFKEVLEKKTVSASKKRRDKERVYLILLNIETGGIRFAQQINTLESQFPRTPVKGESYQSWQQVRLIVQDQEGMAHFDLCDVDEKPLDPSCLKDTAAWNVVSETMDVLNTIAKVSKVASGELLPEAVILSNENLSTIQISPEQDNVDQLKGWADSLDRIEAEQKLFSQPVGSYVIRKLTPVTQSIVDQIQNNNNISFLKSFLLTIVEQNDKISDILLIRTEKGWTYYQDDVHLDSKTYTYYPSIQILLDTLVRRVRGIIDF